MRRLARTLRRLFFMFPTPLRTRLWDEMSRLANANSYEDAEGSLRYGPLTDEQRARLARIHDILGSKGPLLFPLVVHQWIEGLVLGRHFRRWVRWIRGDISA